jgi:antitoxin (DNA-binding transcriptional repressor) of toxin-antitoxin stability system
VSKFKATCLAVLQRVRKTCQPILVARFGEPIAKVVPPRPTTGNDGWLGCMSGRAGILGDLMGPLAEPEDREVDRG